MVERRRRETTENKMDRRDFMKGSLLAAGGSLVTGACREEGGVKPSGRGTQQSKLRIQYIREQIPSFEIPPYGGKSYEDTVPDTFDIEERAKLAIHGITSITDPNADYEIFWFGNFYRNPPVLIHDFSDWCQNVEGLMEVLPLLRAATGSRLNDQVDPVWMVTLLKSVGPDGLVYVPLNGRPWSRVNAAGVEPVWRKDGSKTHINDPSVSQVANSCTCQRSIGTMTVYYLRDKNPMWRAAIERMIQRLSALAINRGDYCYFPMGSFEPNGRAGERTAMPLGSLWGNTLNARLIQGLMQYYKVAGYEPARELAGKLNHFTRYHGQAYNAETGAWLLDPEIKGLKKWDQNYDVEGLELGGHGQGHGIGLLSMLEYGTVLGDRETMEFVKGAYEWGKNPGSEYGVSSRVGWFPEFYVPGYRSCESCTVGDMLGLAVKLTEANEGDYWDDIDRWVRNHFAEAQLTETDWVYEMADQLSGKTVAFNETSQKVPERNVGAWSGWATGGGWAIRPTGNVYGDVVGFQHCCTGNTPRGLYYVWEHMIERQGERLRVNLLLNRASRWADVYSYIPYEGRVDVKMKEECGKVLLRVPEWVGNGSPEMRCTVNKAARKLNWEGRYVNTGAVKAGDVISVRFPIRERRVKERIGPVTYTLALRGNTVVSLDPAGEFGPFYQNRSHYQRGRARSRKVVRFVSDEDVRW
jgi:hypothetical protein